MKKVPIGYRVFAGRLYQFYLRGTKREIDREAKRLKELGYRIRRTKAKGGWELWKGFKYNEAFEAWEKVNKIMYNT